MSRYSMPMHPTLLPSHPVRPRISQQVAGIVRELCEARGFMRADLARSTGLSRYRVQQICRGGRIRMSDLAEVANVLDVRVSELFPADTEQLTG